MGSKDTYGFRFSCLVILLVFITRLSFSQVQVSDNHALKSRIFHKTIPFTVILPESYDTSARNYPVVYLLHGYGGDHSSWIGRCHINTLIDSLVALDQIDEFIYVLPDAGNSYYINNYNGTFNFTDFFIEEFVPAIDSGFRTLPGPENRTLMGLSMGGFGSIVLALKAPGIFGNVIAMSAAIRNDAIFISLPQDKYEKNFGNVYGPGLIGEDRITMQWKDYSPFYLIDTASVTSYGNIRWYIECGLQDFLLPANEAFHDLLVQYGLEHEYHVRPGKHNWAFWYSSTVNGLIWLSRYY